jgi:hypothetical protein
MIIREGDLKSGLYSILIDIKQRKLFLDFLNDFTNE